MPKIDWMTVAAAVAVVVALNKMQQNKAGE